MSTADSYLDLFAASVVRDAITSATAACWDRRAREFEKARPRPGDFTGQLTPDQIDEQDRRLAAKAQACREDARALRDLKDSARGPFRDLEAEIRAESVWATRVGHVRDLWHRAQDAGVLTVDLELHLADIAEQLTRPAKRIAA